MRLLDRYLLRELLVPLAYCLGGFLIFYSAFDLIAKLNRFQECKMTAGDCVEFYLVTTPEMFVTLAPVALLLALLFAVTNHARHNEFTAIRAAGVSLWRLSVPYLVVGLFLGAMVFCVNEFWAPQVLDKQNEIRERRTSVAHTRSLVLDLKFRNEPENRWWSMKTYDTDTTEMTTLTMVWELPDGSVRQISANHGFYTNGVWVLRNVDEWDQSSRKERVPPHKAYSILPLAISETPELIKSEIKVNKFDIKDAGKKPRLSIEEIQNYMRLHPKLSSGQRSRMETQLQARFAEPFICLIVVLIAIPFGARSGRRNVFVGVASSIFICFSYYIVQNVCLSMGNGGFLPPLVAAWFPNALFGLTGVILTLRVR